MTEADWNPHAEDVLTDQRAAYDTMRSRCPVARDAAGSWTLFRHADVVRAALDPAAFSSRVSSHLNVPNSMDGEEHTRFRALIDRYLAPESIAPYEPHFRQLADDVVLHYLARHPGLQDHLRCSADPMDVGGAIDEILRIDDPFIANRRVTAVEVEIGGRKIGVGQKVVLNWTAAMNPSR